MTSETTKKITLSSLTKGTKGFQKSLNTFGLFFFFPCYNEREIIGDLKTTIVQNYFKKLYIYIDLCMYIYKISNDLQYL